MFHENVYTGRWWETSNKEHGGTIEGIITHDVDTTPTGKPSRAVIEPK
jgi:hypothetical protein